MEVLQRHVDKLKGNNKKVQAEQAAAAKEREKEGKARSLITKAVKL